MSTKDSNDGSKPGAFCAQSHTPAWWTDGLQTSWSKVRADTVRDWRELADGGEVGNSADEAALAFGYGARQFYTKLQMWGGALEDTLKADWKETGHEAACAWDRVHAAVKQGWESGGGQAKATTPQTGAGGDRCAKE